MYRYKQKLKEFDVKYLFCLAVSSSTLAEIETVFLRRQNQVDRMPIIGTKNPVLLRVLFSVSGYAYHWSCERVFL